MTGKSHLAFALAVILTAAPGLALAEEGSGTVTYVSVRTDSADLPGGGEVRRTQYKGVILADDPNSDFHLATQDCAGGR